MDILNPPESYKKYRCAVRGLSGGELTLAQERFYKKDPESRAEICIFFDWLEEQRTNFSLPFERINVKNGHSEKIMIFDIEYWIEGGKLKQKKIYLADQGQLSREDQPVDRKMAAAGDMEEEVPF